MKDAVIAFCVIVFALIFGWGLGKIIDRVAYAALAPKILYCIEGKVYEKNGDYYVTSTPARSCLPVSTD
jgi:hypothetical protein